MTGWADDRGVLRLPGGPSCAAAGWATPRPRPTSPWCWPPDPQPAWPHRRVRWPDFSVPTDTADAVDALHEARRRAVAGERVEVACAGGVGRTGRRWPRSPSSTG